MGQGRWSFDSVWQSVHSCGYSPAFAEKSKSPNMKSHVEIARHSCCRACAALVGADPIGLRWHRVKFFGRLRRSGRDKMSRLFAFVVFVAFLLPIGSSANV